MRRLCGRDICWICLGLEPKRWSADLAKQTAAEDARYLKLRKTAEVPLH